MQIARTKYTAIVKCAFSDEAEITLTDKLYTPEGVYQDLSSTNTIIQTVDSIPDDFAGNDYKYSSNQWVKL